jgi:histidinol-phosphate phosphatase family protein
MKLLKDLNIDSTWTLFLDRDGVINEKIENDYVKSLSDFEFIEGSLEALEMLEPMFDYIVVVTNQQGIGKGLMTEADLLIIHQKLVIEVTENGGRIDKIYHCPNLAADNAPCRKPSTGMAFQAREDFPEIDFTKSIMVGDSQSDMEFGDRLGMKCVKIGEDENYESFESLFHFAHRISIQ